ncbi:DUF2971 domain-containing protein [Kangiella marina]|uniref:DUF2971 domain-containing protein n=1 Tax=Kangiella marina TaxID=1079178 RepID=A0ABP8IA04_9GAMM
MKTLYKYMPLRMDFFDEPLLRLTPPLCLNDPFDSKPTREAIRKKVAFMSDEEGEGAGYISDENLDTVYSRFKEFLEEGLNNFGIVSLTENPHNLLMWSHYADQHRGIVIELSELESTFEFSDSSDTSRVGSKTPLRVLYDSKRPSSDISDELIFTIFEDDFFRHFALVKSDAWIYEKEHRFILPINQAEVGVFLHNKNVASKSELEVYLKQRGISYEKREGKYFFRADNLNNPINNVAKVCRDEFLLGAGEVLLFKRIADKSLKAIYFGCKVSDEIINSVVKKVRSNNVFSENVVFYRATESSDYFDVSFDLI